MAPARNFTVKRVYSEACSYSPSIAQRHEHTERENENAVQFFFLPVSGMEKVGKLFFFFFTWLWLSLSFFSRPNLLVDSFPFVFFCVPVCLKKISFYFILFFFKLRLSPFDFSYILPFPPVFFFSKITRPNKSFITKFVYIVFRSPFFFLLLDNMCVHWVCA